MSRLPFALVLLAFLAQPARGQDGGLELVVEVPAGTKGPVCVALDEPINGKPAWTADAIKLSKDEKTGHWTGRIPLAQGRTLEWKLTQGSWDTVEKDSSGGELPNRATSAGAGWKKVNVKVERWAEAGDAKKGRPVRPVVPGLVDLGVWKPAKLPSPRQVVAWLPPGYDDPANKDRRYPVLYVLDGQNQFDPKMSFTGVTWGLAESATAHVKAGHEAFIAIAIDNTPERAEEYLPSKDERRSAGGRLGDFAAFLWSELKPKVDERFRTKPGPDDTGIIGSSFGGMAAFHLGWRYPDKVRRVASMSPSLWWNHHETRALVESAKEKPPLRIWLDMGTAEGKDVASSKPYLEASRGVRDALVQKGFKVGKDLEYFEDEGAIHHEKAWAKRLPRVLGFLFP